ncbi:hypothetical protein RIVM261_078880 [Rivularia sp. IAM M-261]|nr:hypothetical protein RIVM261_078880 [Rivularia sp. IAM M-261]
MEVNKFVPGKFDIRDEDETGSIRIVADLAPEEEFIENLKYWTLETDKYNNLYIINQDTYQRLMYSQFLEHQWFILNNYYQLTPESFYELNGLFICLNSMNKKYRMHKNTQATNPGQSVLTYKNTANSLIELLELLEKIHSSIGKKISKRMGMPSLI